MNLTSTIKSSILLSSPTAHVVFNARHHRVVAVCALAADAVAVVVEYAAKWGVVAVIIAPADLMESANATRKTAC